jgi:ABC-type glycerol-3-phosphate transport system substrate-binding protein
MMLMTVLLVFVISCNKTKNTGSVAGFKSTLATAEERLHEKYKEPVTITAVLGYRESENPNTPSSATPQTQTAIKYFKDNLNVDLKFNWMVNNDQFDAKFAAELAAGSLPDVMWLSPNMFQDLYEQGGLMDITDVWAQYSNPAMDRIYNPNGTGLGATTRDGKIYGLPNLSFNGQSTSQMYYRMDTLKSVGINSYDDLPKTIAEFEALCGKLLAQSGGKPILPAVKQYIDAGLADFSPVFHAYESWTNGWVDFGSGNLEYVGIQPNVKKALAKLNEWYQKGYFEKDFAAQDVWAADSPVIADIVAGRYSVVPGSWWIPNWPLNMHKGNEPNADWVVGPTLTVDGKQPVIEIQRFALNNVIAISRNCKNPEAVLKMINADIEYNEYIQTPEYLANRTPAQKAEEDSWVYTWLPWKIYDSTILETNFNFVHALEERGIFNRDQIPADTIPINNEISAWLNWYTRYHNGEAKDNTVWGFYTSRMAPNGGVAKMLGLYNSAKKYYGEVYITTPTMITKSAQLNDYRNTTFLRIIMGEIPVSDFDKYVSEWRNLGGNEIGIEVNEWYHSK